MNSDSQLDSDIANMIFKTKVKNSNFKIVNDATSLTQCTRESSSGNDSNERSENIVDVTSEIRVDVLRLLTIVKKMEFQIRDLDLQLKQANLKIEELELGSTNSNSTDTNNSSHQSQSVDLNEYEIKLDKFKKDVNTEFTDFKTQLRIDFDTFRQNIVQAARIRNVN
jgi:hypothetical protein